MKGWAEAIGLFITINLQWVFWKAGKAFAKFYINKLHLQNQKDLRVRRFSSPTGTMSFYFQHLFTVGQQMECYENHKSRGHCPLFWWQNLWFWSQMVCCQTMRGIQFSCEKLVWSAQRPRVCFHATILPSAQRCRRPIRWHWPQSRPYTMTDLLASLTISHSWSVLHQQSCWQT